MDKVLAQVTLTIAPHMRTYVLETPEVITSFVCIDPLYEYFPELVGSEYILMTCYAELPKEKNAAICAYLEPGDRAQSPSIQVYRDGRMKKFFIFLGVYTFICEHLGRQDTYYIGFEAVNENDLT